MQCYVGVDIGTSNTKASIVDAAGKVLVQHIEPNPMLTERPGWSEHDMAQSWWAAPVACIRAALAACDIDPACIEGVMLSGMSPSLGLGSADGAPLRRGITQSDVRQPQRGVEDYGLSPWDHAQVNTYIIPRLLWVKENEAQTYAAVRKLFMAHSYLCYRLSGRYCIDFNTACWLTPLFDRERRQFDRAALDAIGLHDCALPDVLSPIDVAGEITPEAAKATGLAVGTKIMVGTGDFYLSQMASGMRDPGDAMLYFGSVGIMLACAEPAMSFLRKPSQVGMAGDPFLMGPIFPVSGLLLQWYIENFAPNARALASTENRSALALMDARAAQVPIGAERLLFLPHLHGERNPDVDPNARGVLYGLTMNHGPEHVYRALMESFLYSVRRAMEAMGERGQIISVKHLFVSGGGARSALWRQMTSDILGYDLSYIAGFDEAFAGAYLAAMGCGAFADEEAFYSEWLPGAETATPNPADRQKYEKVYRSYGRLSDLLRGSYKDILDF